jgi:transposase
LEQFPNGRKTLVLDPRHQRLGARSSGTAPSMAALNARLTAMVGQLFSQSKLAEAINYALNY